MDRKTLESIDKPFGELDKVTQWALLGCWYEGEGLQEYDTDNCVWVKFHGTPLSEMTLRLAPQPLTPDSIDWSHVADKRNYMARDVVGLAFIYTGRPAVDGAMWAPGRLDDCQMLNGVFASYTRGTCDWTDSLVVRPGYEEEK